MLYELPDLEHIDVKSVNEAVFWLHKYGEKAEVNRITYNEKGFNEV